MVALLIRLLALLGVLWTGKHVLSQVSSVFSPGQNVKDKAPGEKVNGEMVKDPVCQTYIPKSIAVHKKIDGAIYYFCSEACASKFVEAKTTNQTEQEQVGSE